MHESPTDWGSKGAQPSPSQGDPSRNSNSIVWGADDLGNHQSDGIPRLLQGDVIFNAAHKEQRERERERDVVFYTGQAVQEGESQRAGEEEDMK